MAGNQFTGRRRARVGFVALALTLGVAGFAGCDVSTGYSAEDNANEACNEIARSTGLDEGLDAPIPSRAEARPHIEKAVDYAEQAGRGYSDLAQMMRRYERTWKSGDAAGFYDAASDVTNYCIDLQG